MLPSRLTTLKPWIAGLLPAVLLTCLPQHLQAAETTPPATAQRVPWTSSAVTGSPSPPLPWVAERVFPELTFTHCLDLTFIPGTDRLLVVEQAGRILSFPNRNDVAAADLAANLAEEIPGVKQVYALAFHPDFLQNRYCYVCCIKEAEDRKGGGPKRWRTEKEDRKGVRRTEKVSGTFA